MLVRSPLSARMPEIQIRRQFILLVVFTCILSVFTEMTPGGGDNTLANGSTRLITWRTNTSLGLTDRMRNYGKGFQLTPEEEVALDKFRPLVQKYATLPFERRDNFLIKFLRARQLDVPRAVQMFRAAMDWRRERDLNGLLEKDFSKWEKMFPFIISGHAKLGDSIVFVPAASYDMRKAVIAGHLRTLIDLFDRAFELGTRTGVAVYETTGENAGLSAILILDLAGFNLRQHACTGCLSIYVHLINVYERYYPQLVRKLFLVNAPRSAQVVLDIVKPLMSTHTASALEVYGVDRSEWEPVLKEYIDEDQLLVRFGGTRTITNLTSQTYGG